MIGHCKFCGTGVIIPEELAGESEDKIVMAATMSCTCDRAQDLQWIENRKEQGKAKIEHLFNREVAAKAVLLEAVDGIVEGKIKKVTINVGDGIKGTVGLNKDMFVQVNKTTTDTEVL